ncbi:MAG: TlpA family protein disulfide reductase [Spirochaetes bacterium]|nr:TlpA family protein disulfide reductase [Spirochaetota bacterium]
MKKLKKRIFILLLMSGLLFLPLSVPAEKAFNVMLYNMDNKMVNLKKVIKKEYTILSFGATYCKPCKKEIKELINLEKELNQKVDIYLIFVDKSKTKIEEYLKDNEITLTVLHDLYQMTMKRYSVKALPSIFLINKKMEIIYKIKGYHPKTIEKLKKIIESGP